MEDVTTLSARHENFFASAIHHCDYIEFVYLGLEFLLFSFVLVQAQVEKLLRLQLFDAERLHAYGALVLLHLVVVH